MPAPPRGPELVDAFYERTGSDLVVYGATEFSERWPLDRQGLHTQWSDKKGSVGRAFPECNCRSSTTTAQCSA